MPVWENRITSAFLDRFEGKNNEMRLRSVSIFPDFDGASAGEKESYLEAAEALEQKNLLILNWEKRGKGERLKTLVCPDIKKLFEAAGRKNPVLEAGEIRAFIKEKISMPEKARSHEKMFLFLDYLAENFKAADAKRGMDSAAISDFICLAENYSDIQKLKNITTRALSIQLYNDSKRLEYLLEFISPFLSRAKKEGVPIPDFSFLERSFPATMISGKLVFEFAPVELEYSPPLLNERGIILGLPFQSALEIQNIKTIEPKEKPAVLTIENKETFYALASGGGAGSSFGINNYDCCLYSGGYPNRAVSAVIRLLASSGFSFFHAGDLDADGILILQNIKDIAEKPVSPLCMDAATFNRYLLWSKPAGSALSRLESIREETRAIPGIAELICRIEETGRCVEQEIIDYRLTQASAC
ncbi:MAG: DUF2220 family protein [Spirochaetaceae bacterium]|jgi:hypothetical protein|nr:DUF2220 family protein [Spirochaetaceae bacterium]